MKTLKKNNISKGSSINSPVPVNKDCELPPFFNPDYFAHVVVQTIEELNSIPCKLRQDGMLASIVQDEYSEWQLQSSKTGFGVCDNRAWVKIVKGDSQYDGGNLFLFDTEADANNYIDTTLDAKQGQMFYIAELDNYYKFNGQDGYTAIVEEGDFIPLAGTEVGRPITGTMAVDLPNTMQPLFKRSVVRGNLSTEDSFIFDNHLYYVSEKSVTGQNYSLSGFAMIGQNDPSKPDDMYTQIGHSKWHSTDDSQKYSAIISMYRGLGSADFSSGFTSKYTMDELRPTDDKMFVQRSYVKKALENLPKGDYIPLSGSEENKPVTGTIKVELDSSIETGMKPLLQTGEFVSDSGELVDGSSTLFLFEPNRVSYQNMKIVNGGLDSVYDNTYVRSGDFMSVGWTIGGATIGKTGLSMQHREDGSVSNLTIHGKSVEIEENLDEVKPSNKKLIAQRSYVDNNRQFVKNGVGWSLKYRADNPTFYGAIGTEAVDFSVSKSVNTVMPERFSYGANGFNAAVFGIYNSAMDAGSLVSGVQNRSQGQCNNIMSSNSTIIQDKGTGNFIKKDNGIYSGSHNTIENNRSSTVIGGGNNRMVGKISPVNNMYDMYNAIIGGNYNTLTNSISNTILGGTLNNIIGEEKSRENGSYNSNNAIIGGYKNKIITATGTNRQAYSSVIFGGEENIAQGHYNMIAGYGNHAVTICEVLTGMYGTVQNTSLSGYDFIRDSRMFNVGIGESTTQRRDGLSVFRNGLVTAPRLTTPLINANPRSLVTKEYVDSKTGVGDIVLTSPNGTKFSLSVTDLGELVTTEITG